MAAPKGNQFWKLRTKHGRYKLFESPEILWEECCKYFEWCDKNPLLIHDIKGRDNEDVYIEKRRVYTWEGLELYLNIDSLREYKTNPDYKDFSQVVKQVSKIIYNQKFTGATSGEFNSSIIARDLGLVDKRSNDVKQDIKLNLSDEDIERINKKLDEEY